MRICGLCIKSSLHLWDSSEKAKRSLGESHFVLAVDDDGGLLMALLGAQEDLRGQWFIVGEEAEKISKRKPMGKEAT